MILEMSDFYKIEIHIVVSIYVLILILLVVVLYLLRRTAHKKEEKIIDFLPFLKSSKAKLNIRFL